MVQKRGRLCRFRSCPALTPSPASCAAAAAAANRPLQRIMWIEDKGDAIEIATTDGHLATRIGKAIEAACKGTLSIKRGHEDQLTRVYWERKD